MSKIFLVFYTFLGFLIFFKGVWQDSFLIIWKIKVLFILIPWLCLFLLIYMIQQWFRLWDREKWKKIRGRLIEIEFEFQLKERVSEVWGRRKSPKDQKVNKKWSKNTIFYFLFYNFWHLLDSILSSFSLIFFIYLFLIPKNW